jgi:hypothetical protein
MPTFNRSKKKNKSSIKRSKQKGGELPKYGVFERKIVICWGPEQSVWDSVITNLPPGDIDTPEKKMDMLKKVFEGERDIVYNGGQDYIGNPLSMWEQLNRYKTFIASSGILAGFRVDTTPGNEVFADKGEKKQYDVDSLHDKLFSFPLSLANSLFASPVEDKNVASLLNNNPTFITPLLNVIPAKLNITTKEYENMDVNSLPSLLKANGAIVLDFIKDIGYEITSTISRQYDAGDIPGLPNTNFPGEMGGIMKIKFNEGANEATGDNIYKPDPTKTDPTVYTGWTEQTPNQAKYYKTPYTVTIASVIDSGPGSRGFIVNLFNNCFFYQNGFISLEIVWHLIITYVRSLCLSPLINVDHPGNPYTEVWDDTTEHKMTNLDYKMEFNGIKNALNFLDLNIQPKDDENDLVITEKDVGIGGVIGIAWGKMDTKNPGQFTYQTTNPTQKDVSDYKLYIQVKENRTYFQETQPGTGAYTKDERTTPEQHWHQFSDQISQTQMALLIGTVTRKKTKPGQPAPSLKDINTTLKYIWKALGLPTDSDGVPLKNLLELWIEVKDSTNHVEFKQLVKTAYHVFRIFKYMGDNSYCVDSLIRMSFTDTYKYQGGVPQPKIDFSARSEHQPNVNIEIIKSVDRPLWMRVILMILHANNYNVNICNTTWEAFIKSLLTKIFETSPKTTPPINYSKYAEGETETFMKVLAQLCVHFSNDNKPHSITLNWDSVVDFSTTGVSEFAYLFFGKINPIAVLKNSLTKFKDSAFEYQHSIMVPNKLREVLNRITPTPIGLLKDSNLTGLNPTNVGYSLTVIINYINSSDYATKTYVKELENIITGLKQKPEWKGFEELKQKHALLETINTLFIKLDTIGITKESSEGLYKTSPKNERAGAFNIWPRIIPNIYKINKKNVKCPILGRTQSEQPQPRFVASTDINIQFLQSFSSIMKLLIELEDILEDDITYSQIFKDGSTNDLAQNRKIVEKAIFGFGLTFEALKSILIDTSEVFEIDTSSPGSPVALCAPAQLLDLKNVPSQWPGKTEKMKFNGTTFEYKKDNYDKNKEEIKKEIEAELQTLVVSISTPYPPYPTSTEAHSKETDELDKLDKLTNNYERYLIELRKSEYVKSEVVEYKSSYISTQNIRKFFQEFTSFNLEPDRGTAVFLLCLKTEKGPNYPIDDYKCLKDKPTVQSTIDRLLNLYKLSKINTKSRRTYMQDAWSKANTPV